MPYLGLNKEALDTDGSGCISVAEFFLQILFMHGKYPVVSSLPDVACIPLRLSSFAAETTKNRANEESLNSSFSIFLF